MDVLKVGKLHLSQTRSNGAITRREVLRADPVIRVEAEGLELLASRYGLEWSDPVLRVWDQFTYRVVAYEMQRDCYLLAWPD